MGNTYPPLKDSTNLPSSDVKTSSVNLPVLDADVAGHDGYDAAVGQECCRLVTRRIFARKIAAQRTRMLKLLTYDPSADFGTGSTLCRRTHRHDGERTKKALSEIESTVVLLKHRIASQLDAAECVGEENRGSREDYRHIGWGGSYQPSPNCVTFELFNIVAPLIPGSFTTSIQLRICVVDNAMERVKFADKLGPFAIDVNTRAPRSHVVEYWIPSYREGYDELLLILETHDDDPDEEAINDGDSTLTCRGKQMGNISSAAGKEESAAGLSSPKKKAPRSRPIRPSPQEEGIEPFQNEQSNKKGKRGRAINLVAGDSPARKDRRLSAADLPTGRRSNSNHAAVKKSWRVNGAKSIGQWYDSDDPTLFAKGKLEFAPNYGSNGMNLTSREEMGRDEYHLLNGKTSNYSAIKRLHDRSRVKSRGACTVLKMEVSNEHGYGERKKLLPIKRRENGHSLLNPECGLPMEMHCSSGISREKRTCIEYKFVKSSKSDGSSDECSNDAGSSDYGSLSRSDNSTNSPPPSSINSAQFESLDALLSSVDSLPQLDDVELTCPICDQHFTHLPTLMLHLNSSYPSFRFRYGKNGSNVIDVTLKRETDAHITKGTNNGAPKPNFFLKRSFVKQWRWKLSAKLNSYSGVAPYIDRLVSAGRETDVGKVPIRDGTSVILLKGVQKPRYEDLFLETLPFPGPSYTKLKDPPVHHLFGVDSNQSWLRDLSNHKLNQFLDVSPTERAFFTLWNSFVVRRKNRSVGYGKLSALLHAFIDERGRELIGSNLILSFVCHCISLEKKALIGADEMSDAILRLQRLHHRMLNREARLSSSSGGGEGSPHGHANGSLL